MSVCIKQNGELVKAAGLYRTEAPLSVADIYTETERQIGLWQNGKPLYQRTLVVNSTVALGTQYSLTHDLTNIEEIVEIRGVYNDITDGRTLPLNNLRVTMSESVWIACYVNDTTHIPVIAIQSGGYNYGNITNIRITVKYTKTTDTPTNLLPSNMSSLYMLGDVEISNPQSGQAIIFDDTDNKWKNGEGGGGGTANIWSGTQAELEEDFENIEDGTQIVVYDDEQEVVEGGTIYSEDEQMIGLWKNLKPLYQKTITITSASIVGNTVINVTSQFSNLNIESLVATESFITCTSNGHVYKYNDESVARLSIEDDSTYSVSLSISSGTITNLTVNLTVKYTKSTDVPLDDVVVGKSTMYIASSDCYSTVEKEVGCNVDGKPLYQKTFHSTDVAIAANGRTVIISAVDLSSLSIDKVVGGIAGCADFNNGANIIDIPYAVGYSNGSICAYYDNTYGVCIHRLGGAFTLDNLYLTIQYTKTSDTAGSGQYTPASGKTKHYSTDEQVIGTWIDGATIYEKTFYWSSGLSVPVSGVWYDTNTNISYVNKIVDAVIGNDTWKIGVLSVFKESNNLKITSAGNLGSNSLSVTYITLRYTKSA